MSQNAMDDFKPIDNAASIEDDTQTDCPTVDDTKPAKTLELPSQPTGNEGGTHPSHAENSDLVRQHHPLGGSSRDHPSFGALRGQIRILGQLLKLVEEIDRGSQAHAQATTEGETQTSLDKPVSASNASQTSEIKSTGETLDADKHNDRLLGPSLRGQADSARGFDTPAMDASSQTVPPALTEDENKAGGDPDAESSEAL